MKKVKPKKYRNIKKIYEEENLDFLEIILDIILFVSCVFYMFKR